MLQKRGVRTSLVKRESPTLHVRLLSQATARGISLQFSTLLGSRTFGRRLPWKTTLALDSESAPKHGDHECQHLAAPPHRCRHLLVLYGLGPVSYRGLVRGRLC